jgi:putative aldouronate transport system permease protein
MQYPIPGRKFSSDKIFDFFNVLLMLVILFVVLYPLWFIVIASVSDPDMVMRGEVILRVKGATLEGYRRLMDYFPLWQGYRNTIIYVAVGTTINLVLTITGAYALSRRDLAGRRFFSLMIVFTMIFNGGLIPRFLVVRNLGIYDTMWALILPGAVAVYNLIIARTFFESTIPNELYESASIDGCGNLRFFVLVVLPLSPSIIAVLVLFYGVAHWNSFFDALIYLRSSGKSPLQLVLRDLLITFEVLQGEVVGDSDTLALKQQIADLIRYGVIIVSSLPVIAVYPFLQRYFVKGVMVGAIKG